MKINRQVRFSFGKALWPGSGTHLFVKVPRPGEPVATSLTTQR